MTAATIFRSPSLMLFALGASLALGTTAQAQDAFDTATHQLTVPDLAIGTLGFENLVVTVNGIDKAPSGFSRKLPFDVFDPASGQLTIASVEVGANTFYNPVVSTGTIVSVSSVSGADSYASGELLMPAVQVLGGALFTGVTVQIGAKQITGVAGGLPSQYVNIYNPAAGDLLVPIARFNGQYYTNVTARVSLSDVKGVGGTQPPTTALAAFPGGSGGAAPSGNLFLSTNGNFYGTTRQGGASGHGSVFRRTPQGVVTVLYSFAGYNSTTPTASDGAAPSGALAQDGNGNLYGTTFTGGKYNSGTVYKIAPNGTESLLYSFSGAGGIAFVADGALPASGLTLATDGFLYGTTLSGGTSNLGTTFRINTTGTEQVLTSFLNDNAGVDGIFTDGNSPYGALIEAPGGQLFYGTASAGGMNQTGTVFVLSLVQQTDPAHPNATEKTVYPFGNGASGDGNYPLTSLVRMSDGNLYGTTLAGGADQAGALFRVNPTSQVETLLYSFSGSGEFNGGEDIANGPAGSLDGAFPGSALIVGPNDVLFGVTQYGGAYGQGTVYQVDLGGQEKTLHSFSGGGVLGGSADGAQPNGILLGTNGDLYGTSTGGGSAGNGMVFQLVP